MNSNEVLELIQARLLAEIFNQDIRGQIALKGGMAMRVAYDNVRYTNDIDLAADPETTTPARVRGVVRNAIKNIQKSGVITQPSINEHKQTDTVQRWKFNGFVGDVELHMKVEVSRRDPLPRDHVQRVDWTPPTKTGQKEAVSIDVFDVHALARSKISCICSDREAARDVMDLHALIKAGAEPSVLLQELPLEEIDRMQRDTWDRLEKLDWANVRTSLEGSLPADVMADVDAEIWDRMRLEVGEKMQTWLSQARETALEGDAETIAP